MIFCLWVVLSWVRLDGVGFCVFNLLYLMDGFCRMVRYDGLMLRWKGVVCYCFEIYFFIVYL